MVCPSYPPQDVTCGVGDYTYALVEALRQQGETVVVVCSADYRGPCGPASEVLPIFREWSLASALRLLLSRVTPRGDIVHLQYTPELYGRGQGFKLVPLLARLLRRGSPTVITFHTLTGGSPWSKLWAVLLLATAHRSISANEEVTAMVRRRLPWLGRRLTEIPIGPSVPVGPATGRDRETGRGLLGVPLESPLLVHFGLVYPGKGVETLFAALPELVRRQPGTLLAMVGDTRPEDKEYRQTLEALADRLGVATAILWAGSRPGEEVSRILQGADVFIVPYDGGASTRRSSLMAGLVHGLPVVSTTPAVFSAYLKDGENISLVPPRNPQALSARIASLLATPAEAARLSEGARRLAGRFTWEAIARETRALYTQVLRR